MTEAFEIGITLALDNGVSAGIAAIRRDLDALDRAIAGSANGLLALHRLSAGLIAGAPSYPSILAPASHPMPAPTEAEPEADASPPASTAPTLTIMPEPAAATQPAPAANASILSEPPVPPPVAVANAPIPLSPPPTISPAASPITRPTPPPAAPAALPPIEAAPPSAAIVTHPVPRQLAEVRPPEPLTFTATVAASPPPKPPPVKLASIPQPLLLHHPQFQPEAAAPPSRQPQTMPLQMPIPLSQSSPVPTHRSSPATPIAPIAAMSPAGSPTRSIPPLHSQFPAFSATESGPSRSRAASPPHGEIILDGARLGRWIADRLARAVDRPQSGITGFDPRVSPLYAGAPNGS